MWNSANPYDSVGYWHNEGLDYIAEHKSQIDTTSDSITVWADTKTQISNYFVSKGYNQSTIENQMDDLVNFYDILPDYNSVSEALDAENIITNSNMLGFISQIEDLNDTYQVDSNRIDYYYDDLKAIEDSILNSSLSSSNKEILLKSTSILRFSARYWKEVNINSSHPWRDMDGDGQSTPAFGISQETENYIALATSDGIGFYVAEAAGAVTGTAATACYIYWDEIEDGISKIAGAVGDFFGGIF